MNAVKLPFQFDYELIQQEIAQFTQADYDDLYNPSLKVDTLWSKHFIVPVGGPDTPIVFKPNDALKKCPYIQSILETFKCKKETFRIHSLNAGAHISAHRDIGYSVEHGIVRLHIPVATNDQVEIIVNEEHIVMKNGECWYCNFHLTHEVTNKSDTPRTHLIMDCVVNDWLSELFSAQTVDA